VLRSKFHPGRDYTLAAVSALTFTWLALTIPVGGPTPLDIAGRAAIHASANPALTAAMKFATQLGGGWFLTPLAVLIVGSMFVAGRRRDAALFTIAVLGANLLNESMKLIFHRPRPIPWFEYPRPGTYSFPSGHSFVSFCFYLSLAEILIQDDWPLSRKMAMWTAAALLTLSIGFSRAYLGVHYPTDVLAGFVAATAWTTLIRIAHHTFLSPRTAPVRSEAVSKIE
jgi:undecaprenyl-diphosphatase